MTDISVTKTEYQVENRSWLLGPHGTEPGTTPSVTLDIATFVEATHYPNGFLPSGLPVGRITASGLYGLYAGRANEVQTIDLGGATAGTITIDFDGEVTGAIAFDATAAAVQAELEGLSNIDPGDVAVTDGPLPGTITLTFGGRYAGVNVPEVVVTPSGLTGGTVTVATTTEGGSAAADGRETAAGLLFSSVKVPASGANPGGAILVHGFVDADRLPVTLDAAGQGDLSLIHFAS